VSKRSVANCTASQDIEELKLIAPDAEAPPERVLDLAKDSEKAEDGYQVHAISDQ
jgi:hypothetical protein